MVDKSQLAALVLVAFVLFVVIPAVKHAAVIQQDAVEEVRDSIQSKHHRSLKTGKISVALVDLHLPPVATMLTPYESAASYHERHAHDNGEHHDAPVAANNKDGQQISLPRGVACYRGQAKAWRPGKCADDNAWMVPWMATRPQHDWIVVDVGANKGYVIAGWLETLLGPQRTPYTPHNLGVSIYTNNQIKEGFLNMCGGCTECLDPPARVPAEHRARSVKVYGFEPSIANFRWLSFFFNDSGVVNLTNAAVSHTPGVAYFPDGPLGKETGKVSAIPAEGFLPVKIVALDDYLPHNLSFIDVLSTDAEGFDQDVAKGARSFIANGRVGVYQFEMYRAEDYKTIFEQLYQWGYVCYYFTEARKGYTAPWLIRISGCWQEYFQNLIGWVNGLCYNTRIPELQPIFSRLSRKMHRNGGPTRNAARRGVLNFVAKYVKKPES